MQPSAIAPQQQQFVSFCGDDFIQGGLFDNVDVSIRDIVFTEALPSPEYHSEFPVYFAHAYLDTMTETSEMLEGWWSCGGLKDHQIVDDEGNPAAEGHRVMGSSMMRGSNFHHFITALEALQFPKQLTRTGDLRALITTEVHLERKPISREGLRNAPRADGRASGSDVLLPTKLMHIPGDKRVAKAKPVPAATAARTAAAPAARARTAAAARPAAAAAAPATPAAVEGATAAAVSAPAAFDSSEIAMQVLSNILEGKPEGIPLAEAKLAANRELINVYNANLIQRNKVVGLLFNPDWLAAQGVAVEGETLVLAV